MKAKLTLLLILLGGVIGGFTAGDFNIHYAVVAIIGGLALGMSFLLFTSVYSGKVWGIKIKATSKAVVVSLISAIGLIVGGYSIVITFLTAFTSLLRGEIVVTAISVLGFAIPLAVGPIIAKVIQENQMTAKAKNAMVLGELEIFKDIDANMDEAVNFVVGFEGVALFSKTNYCYAVYLYENYALGELSSPAEVAMVGTYFVQKYHDRYTFKVDVEIIPGEPGQTVVAVGTGGIGVARIQGTPDQRLFRSYIFTRK